MVDLNGKGPMRTDLKVGGGGLERGSFVGGARLGRVGSWVVFVWAWSGQGEVVIIWARSGGGGCLGRVGRWRLSGQVGGSR